MKGIRREKLTEDRFYVAIIQNRFDLFRNYSIIEMKDYLDVNKSIKTFS
jgi:hypothetical protein